MVADRRKRIVIGICFPIFIIPLIIFIAGLVLTRDPGMVLSISVGYVLFSILLMSVPAILYSLIMEYWVNPKFENNYVVVIISTLLGLAASAILHWLNWYLIGAIIGFILGHCCPVNFHNSAI
jgi:hypothetical protein